MSVSINKLKAAYIYRFIPFVKWESPNKVIPVSFQSESEVFTILSAMVKKKDKYDVKLAQHAQENSVLYLSCEQILSAEQVNEFQKKSILLISSCDGDVDKGVMINLVQIDGKLKFKINNTSAKKATLKISSQLLKLALVIK
jgi:hypothetical protein